MKKLVICFLAVLSTSIIEAYPMQDWLKEQEREINEKFDRIQNNVYQQEQLRLQREMLKQQRQQKQQQYPRAR